MRTGTDPRFWKCFDVLPPEIQQLARHRHQLWQKHPFHPSLHFKELQSGVWSARINQKYRALARQQGDLFVWFWIGTHDQYEAKI